MSTIPYSCLAMVSQRLFETTVKNVGSRRKEQKKTSSSIFFFKKSDYAHKQNLPAMEENRMVEFAGRQQTACKLAACSLQITRIST